VPSNVLTRAGFLIILLALHVACSNTQPQVRENAPSPSIPSPVVAPQQTDPQLAKKLDDLLKQPEFATARWGIAVLALDSGKVIYQHNGDSLFTPASNMKLYTTAVALDLLGADYRWRTSIYSASDPDQNGTINGDLVLYGRGAPDLFATNRRDNTNSLEELVKQLQQRGVKQIRGDVIGDESFFRGDPIGQGWQWNDLQWYFGAEASALTINGNSIDISVTTATKPGDQPVITVNDRDNYLQVTNEMKTVEHNSKLKIGIYKGITDNDVRVWGEFPIGARGYGVNLSVHRPSFWAARLLMGALKAHGITVTGSARWRDSKTPDRFDPEGKRELAFVTGESLGEVARTTNKLSVNLYAELILRTLGRERRAALAEPDPLGREFGDDEVACNLMRQWLTQNGIDANSLALHDGSGLSRLNLVTPITTTRLLATISKKPSGRIFHDSLPVAGKDGTLGGRLVAISERVQAKTGTLTYDSSLSGYLTDSADKTLAFSVFCNEFTRSSNPNHLIDMLVTTIAGPSKNAPAER
jgi:D-alanyl-D-alanine carboxypeptidase/D-alanyl-D-alanine-endopeptidase (penicillin-binding protein 4)